MQACPSILFSSRPLLVTHFHTQFLCQITLFHHFIISQKISFCSLVFHRNISAHKNEFSFSFPFKNVYSSSILLISIKKNNVSYKSNCKQSYSRHCCHHPYFRFFCFLLGLPKTLCLRAILSCRNRYNHCIDHSIHVEDDYYLTTYQITSK